MQDVLFPALQRHFGKPSEAPGAQDRLLGADWLADAVFVDQSPIGKTARSNPASYVGAFDEIRKLFADSPLAASASTAPSSNAAPDADRREAEPKTPRRSSRKADAERQSAGADIDAPGMA